MILRAKRDFILQAITTDDVYNVEKFIFGAKIALTAQTNRKFLEKIYLLALTMRSQKTIGWFCSVGVDPNMLFVHLKKNDPAYGQTPMHVTRDPNIWQILLQFGGNPFFENLYGRNMIVEHLSRTPEKIMHLFCFIYPFLKDREKERENIELCLSEIKPWESFEKGEKAFNIIIQFLEREQAKIQIKQQLFFQNGYDETTETYYSR